jgi:hypothetical protein
VNDWTGRCAEVARLVQTLAPGDDDPIRGALGAQAAAAFQQLAKELRDHIEGHPLVDVAVVAEGILVAWAANRDDIADELGRLPTQRYRPRGRSKPDEPLMFGTFALASAARGNAPARDRAIANAREAIAAGRTIDMTRARGAIAPLLDGLEAVARGRGRALDRALGKLVRYHRWRFRERESPRAALDVTATGLARWASRQGIPSSVRDPLLAPLPAEAAR